jgi:hypothetical protein
MPESTEMAANGQGVRRPGLSVAALILGTLSAISIGLLRAPLQARFHRVEVRSDALLLPPPEQTVAASLGYRSALADVIFAHVLVSYGIHFQEKRRFEFVGNYLDAVNALDPKFRAPYRFADTLLTLQPEVVPLESYYKARAILERGLKELPYDQELWSSTGQFLAYIAAGRLPDAKEAAEWRLDGARKLARACELIGNNQNVPYHCIGAALLLSDAGENAASRKFLERLLLVSDDPEIRAMVNLQLSRYDNKQAILDDERRNARLQRAWGRDLPFITRGALFVVGPRTDPARCAGTAHIDDAPCATSWNDWNADLERAEANAEQ